jgi:peptide/nickel transport system permease protein
VWFGGSITLFFLLCSIFSLFWTPFDPNFVDTTKTSLGFGEAGHVLGTDIIGRDLLSGLLAGAKMSVFLGCVTATISVILGTIFAFIAVGISPWVDEVVMRFLDILMAVPGVIVALVIATVSGPSALSTVSVLSVFFAPVIARVVRSATIPLLNEDFVQSARMYGRGKAFVLFRHVLPNILSVLVVPFVPWRWDQPTADLLGNVTQRGSRNRRTNDGFDVVAGNSDFGLCTWSESFRRRTTRRNGSTLGG